MFLDCCTTRHIFIIKMVTMSLRCFALTVTLAAAGVKPGKPGGKAPDAKKELGKLLQPGGDPHDPHANGFEPRPGLDEGGDIWTFGRAHAALHHALGSSQAGSAPAVADALDAFAAEHGLDEHGLGPAHGLVLDGLAHSAAAAAATRRGSHRRDDPAAGLHVLVLDAGLGGHTLRLLPGLLAAPTSDAHEVVAVEKSDHLSDAGARLVAHALDGASGSKVRHTPLLPSDDLSLEDLLDTVTSSDGHGVGGAGFDVVLLGGGSRAEQMRRVETLVERKALRLGSLVHAAAAAEDPEAQWYLDTLHRGVGGGRFEHEVHDVDRGVSAVVSSFRGRDKDGEL